MAGWITDYFKYINSLKNNKLISDKEFANILGFKDYHGDINNLLSEKLRIEQVLSLLISREDLNFVVDRIIEKNRASIISSADDICLHKFNLLGSNNVQVSYVSKPNGIEKIQYNFEIKFDEIVNIKRRIFSRIESLKINVENPVEYNPINWHLDFKSGYVWDRNTWYKKIKTGHLPGVDIKVPWELSRFHHLTTLG
ncbi:unnamed protein product, partial [marine sediment metagenome]